MLKEYLKKPLAIGLIVAALLTVGLVSITKLPIKMYPNMVKPGYGIRFSHREINLPQELFKIYGKDFESQIRNLKGVERLEANYYQGRARYRIESEWNVDEDEMREKLENIFVNARAGSNNKFRYNIWSNSSRSTGAMNVAIGSSVLNKHQLKDFLQKNLRNRLRNVEGVKDAYFQGWSSESTVLEIDRSKLLSFGLSLSRIEKHILQAYQAKRLGSLKASKHASSNQIIVPSEVVNLEELMKLDIPIDQKREISVKLGSIASIKKVRSPENNLYRLNGKDAQFLWIPISPESDVKRACDRLVAELEKFKAENNGFTFDILVNPADFIQNAINNLLLNAFVGGFVAIAIIFVFLGAFSNTLIIAASIPFCVIVAFSLMWIFGVSINIVSLGGMAIGVGMIVDSSIVSLENIYRRMSKASFTNVAEKVEIVLSAAKEVVLPIVASILTSVVVFLPIIFTQSYTQAILGDLAKTVVFTVFISMFAAIVIVPVMSQSFLSTKQNFSLSLRFMPIAIRFYERIMQWLLFSKIRSASAISLVSCLFLVSLLLIPKIKKEIIAVPSTNLLDIRVDLPDNDDIELSKRNVSELESFLKEHPEISSFFTYLWNPGGGFITAKIKDSDKFKELKKAVEEKFEATPEVSFSVNKWDPGAMPLPRVRDFQINLTGLANSDLTKFSDSVMAKANELESRLRRKPWISNSESVSINFKDWIINQTDILKYIASSTLDGSYITEIFEDGRRLNLNFMFQEGQRIRFFEDLKLLPIKYAQKIVPLKAIADVDLLEKSYVPLRYVNGVRMQELVFHFKKAYEMNDGQKDEHREKIKAEIKKLDYPIDLGIDYPDTNREINASYQSFKFALATSICLVFLIIALMFNSIKYPLIILGTVPLALIGVIWGLFISSSTISLNSMLGVILLCGLVVNNGILMIDFYLRTDAIKDTASRILSASSLRFRPILMTTLTTLLGVVPIALAIGESGEILQPLGIAIFFGLLLSAILTLVILPCFVRLVD